MFKRHAKLIKFLVFILIISGAGLLGFETASNEPRLVKPSMAPTAAPADAGSARVKDNAIVYWDYEYTMCAHHVYDKNTADKKMAGLTLTQFQEEYPDVRIVSFEANKLMLRKVFNCYCPDHYILKHYKDELGVFKTVSGTGDQEIYKEIPIRFSEIDSDEKPILEAGKIFDSIEDLESYLENIDTT